MKSADKPTIFLLDLDVLNEVNPIPTGHGRNQPIYERHVTKSGRNRVKWTWAQKRYNRACLEVSLLLHSGFKTSQYVDQDLNKR